MSHPGPNFQWSHAQGQPLWFDSSRATWFGLDTFAIEGYYTTTRTNGFLKFTGGFTYNGSNVYRNAPYDCRCVGISALTGTSSTCDFQVTDGASAVTGAELAFAGRPANADDPLNSDEIAQGNKLGIYINGTASSGCIAYAYFRRVA